ncbi:pentatricopeptide repeat-containing protein At3g24000, mitochondrial isoform X1 [Magnolia sinica]|uniref:pentatricopeptide repeat-containing protein At3g24000, mitochondrial isoform X1 n=1 Tax=Magnolia sinica TaxID=86752 RepID=UPI00265A4B21|nr:pentatricopeptide repeat-containing protein At3g24000, mitochondrial isoform X1 [Magnolia sinica]XP_058067976.1 pentatricopeptide repeat-containing protein At3g24000, mitochondrial isoform X1 [Magnolia sinica]XP_058067984.1 pentatricopeptide repeat-containing protein At3g24000, mitochondrial isoform X1 [Magnolia sinica]XP_058067993.1 pentatricopeptide repeat-containing protein At3g24000, mitochondrial isoform X1 [Magnolia sinica]XP_058068003.1 pentatricopeptide repeat-containing protein At3g
MEWESFSLKMHCPSPPPPLRRLLFRTINLPTFQSRFGIRKNPIFIRTDRPKWSPNALQIVESAPTIDAEVSRRRAGFDSKLVLIKYSSMLQDCAAKKSIDDGRAVHAHLLKSGADPDSHLWNSLVNMYAKCGSVVRARRVFDEMPQRDVVSWNALIAGFVEEGDGSEGVLLFCKMCREGIRPNGFVFATGLKACSKCSDLDFGEQVHGKAIKFGLVSDLFVGSALVDLYAKCGEMKLGEKVFFHMPVHNPVSWNALLNGYVRIGDEEQVLELFYRMTDSETRLSKFTLSSVLKGYAGLQNVREGRAIHSLLIKTGSELDAYLSSSLVDMYSKCGLAEDAYKVFDRIEDPDVVAWSSMISCLDQQGCSTQAAGLFSKMGRMGVRPNQYTLTSLVSVATDIGDQQYGESIHAYIRKLGFDIDIAVGNALVTMYMNFGAVQDGWRMFDAMTDRDTISWNALLSGFHSGNGCMEGLGIFNRMLVECFRPNQCTFISILRSCTNLSTAGYGGQVHAHIIKNGLKNDSLVGTALVDMYAKCGCLENAFLVLKGLDERDVFTWTVFISGCAQTNQGEKAIGCFRQMQREGVSANGFTFASCLRACSSIASLENGRQLHSWVIKSGQLGDGFVGSALIDMYGKCGCLKDAEAAFSELVQRDTVLWNTIICGYSQHGYGEKALKAFQCMVDEGISPDEVTFVGVLSACSHVGLVEEGQKHFDSLSTVYGITPTIEHYACMVDILGRAGKLDEVKHLIEKMALVPTALIWQTVLGACRRHMDVEFGEIAAEKLFEIEPHMDSTYILLSNIYAAAHRWADVVKVRALMSSQGVKKEPGCSWIEVDGQVHVFLPQDGSHPKTREIYRKLKELGEQLTLAGYIPNTDHVLHNVAEAEKKECLLYHSERLALAYGLISTKHGKSIRIFKNLRICGDCHNAIKLISGIMNREIVIRDVSRFHHFQNGSCSCRDYW